MLEKLVWFCFVVDVIFVIVVIDISLSHSFSLFPFHFVGKKLGTRLQEGVYWCNSGPTYETSCEVLAGKKNHHHYHQ